MNIRDRLRVKESIITPQRLEWRKQLNSMAYRFTAAIFGGLAIGIVIVILLAWRN